MNSLIIFTVAVGSNTLGQTAAAPSPSAHSARARPAMEIQRLVGLVGITPAHAQPNQTGWCCLNNRANHSTVQECEKWAGRFFPTEAEARRACQSGELKKQEQQQFFRTWFQGK